MNEPTGKAKANKTDAGNGSKVICRASNVLRSPSPDPSRSANLEYVMSLCRVLFLMLIAGLASCSRIAMFPGYVATVKPAELQQYSQGGSMSTLWYHGSDSRYHYFSHLFKVSTRYRIRRADLHWKSEFPRGSKQPVYCSREFQATSDASNSNRTNHD